MEQNGQYAFVLAAASSQAAGVIRNYLTAHVRDAGQRFLVVENHTYDAVGHSSAAIVASGTATIVTALLGTPMVVVYRVTKTTWLLGRRLVHTPFFSMVNLVAGRQIVPEFIQDGFEPQAVARAVQGLLENPARRDEMKKSLRDVVEQLGPAGSAAAANWLRSPVAVTASDRVPAVGPAVAAVNRLQAPQAVNVLPGAIADAIERSVSVTESMLRTRFSLEGNF